MKLKTRNIATLRPSLATTATGTPVLNDMKPSTEKMTKPPKKLVAQLIIETTTESLRNITNVGK